MPVGFPSFREALRAGTEIFHALRAILKKRGLATGVGDEGGFAPNLKGNQDALDVVMEAIGKAGFRAGGERLPRPRLSPPASSATPPAATSSTSRASPAAIRKGWSRSTRTGAGSIRSCRSRTAARKATGAAGSCSRRRSAAKVQLVGDDVFVTNPEILARGIAEGVGNALLVKLNQIGTVTETLDAIAMAIEGRLPERDLAPLRRDRGHDHRRPGGRHGGRARSRPDRRRAATASPSTTSCCASRKRSATAPSTPAAAPSRSSA